MNDDMKIKKNTTPKIRKVSTPAKKNIVVDSIEMFFESYSTATVKSYKNDLIQYESMLNKTLQSVTKTDILEYIKQLDSKGYKNSTYNRKIYSISKIIDVYVVSGVLKSNPIKEIKIIKKLDKPINRELEINIDLEDVKKVIEFSKPRTALLISFLTTTGLRITELLNIQKEHLKKDEIYTSILVKGKGQKHRTISVKNSLIEEIEKIYNNTDSIYLFHSKKGNQLVRQNTYSQIKKQFLYINKKVNQHMLRHLYINTQINDLGREIKATSLYVGHSSVNITLDIYCNKKLSKEDSNIL